MLFAALTTPRLPFLITGKIPFDADEAVEGRWRGTFRRRAAGVFLGAGTRRPEVYASAGAFALFGSNVAVLKGVTLAFFAIYVALNFVLLDKLTARWTAVSASLLLIFAPPALVFWSLDARAEYVLIMLLGTVLLLLCLAARAEGREQRADNSRLLAVGFVIGMALWIHQLFVAYLIPLAIILAMRSDGKLSLTDRACARHHRGALSRARVSRFSRGFHYSSDPSRRATALQKWRIRSPFCARGDRPVRQHVTAAQLMMRCAGIGPPRRFSDRHAPVLLYSVSSLRDAGSRRQSSAIDHGFARYLQTSSRFSRVSRQ